MGSWVMNDRWVSADSYEAFMGRWSRLLAREFVRWLEPPPGLRWLELGCGTGALTEAILDQAMPASILACDPSDSFLKQAQGNVRDERVTFALAGAGSLPKPSQPLTAFAAGLVLNFIPDPEAALGEIARLLEPGSIVAAYVWDYADGMEFLRIFWEAASDLDPAAVDLDEGRRFPLCAPDPLAALFENSGFQRVSVQPVTIRTRFMDFADFWEPFLAGTGPGPAYVQSLSTEARERLMESLQDRLPPGNDGGLDLSARSWAVRGST
jgi:trans-aconitate methyltransferase